jgi:polynucleotide 5'-hydroxyl-kinase GRC3/NOL9
LNKNVEANKTLLVDGPASVTLQSGAAEVFGSQLRLGQRVVIREGKRLPFWVADAAGFEVSLGRDAAVDEVDGNTVPVSWIDAYQTLHCIKGQPVVAVVLGSVDSGKSSFCTYLINRLVGAGRRVAVLDEDLGQSDIGPPCTIAYAYLMAPVTDLFNVNPCRTVFVGAASPSGLEGRVMAAVTLLNGEIAQGGQADFVVVNTDGWSAGEDAVAFKSRLTAAFKPDVVFCLEAPEPKASLCAALGDALASYRQERITSPDAIKERDRMHRRNLRELGYVRYFQGARVKVYNANHLTVAGIDRSALFSGDEAVNLLVGLYDSKKHFLGVGVVRSVDVGRRAIKVFTTVESKPAVLFFGRVRLDETLHELTDFSV